MFEKSTVLVILAVVALAALAAPASGDEPEFDQEDLRWDNDYSILLVDRFDRIFRRQAPTERELVV